MADLEVRLRGNTFFLLLLRAARDEVSQRVEWGQEKDGYTEPNMLRDMIRLADTTFNPRNQKTFRTYVSDFKKGSKPFSNTYLPFGKPGFAAGFSERMEKEYEKVLEEMRRFVRHYLKYKSSYEMRSLAAGLMLAIAWDRTIPQNVEFDIGDGKVKKSEFKDVENIFLYPFLVSVWFYIVTKKKDASEGAETFLAWTEDKGQGNPREPIIEIGRKYASRIKLRGEKEWEETPEEGTEKTKEETEEEVEEMEQPEEDAAETIEAEVVDDEEEGNEENEEKREGKTINQTMNVYNNYGDGPQIAHIDTFVWGGGKK